MKTLVQDPELEYELQELYILSNHWMSDIHFAEDEIRFLKNMLNNYLVPNLKNDFLKEIENFNNILEQQNANIFHLKNKIRNLLKFIGPLINESNKQISVDLIEKFTGLETEVKTLFESVKQVKKSLFSFTEDVMKTTCTVL
jgi:ferritin-like metal-binding protein YciE